jgi:hypothetical protein
VLQVLRDAIAERPVRELILVDGDEHVARLGVRVPRGQFRDLGVQRALLLVGPACRMVMSTYTRPSSRCTPR